MQAKQPCLNCNLSYRVICQGKMCHFSCATRSTPNPRKIQLVAIFFFLKFQKYIKKRRVSRGLGWWCGVAGRACARPAQVASIISHSHFAWMWQQWHFLPLESTWSCTDEKHDAKTTCWSFKGQPGQAGRGEGSC